MKEKAENVSVNSINSRVQLKLYHSFYRIQVLVSDVSGVLDQKLLFSGT